MKAKISYQTLLLPPPFAVACTFDFDFEGDDLHVDFQMEYLDREHLSLEEIQEEGFSGDDDFQWKGKLGGNWPEFLSNALKNSPLTNDPEEESLWIHLEISDHEKSRSGAVARPEQWDYLLQEVIQGVYEAAGKERSLTIFLKKMQQNQVTDYQVEGHFASRTALINQKPVKWEVLNDLIRLVYSLDYESLVPSRPDEAGWWIAPDLPEAFYPVKKLDASSKKRVEKKLEELLVP